MRCEGLLPAPCVGVLRISSKAKNGSVWLLLHLSSMRFAVFTPDYAFPFALACPGALVQFMVDVLFGDELLKCFRGKLGSIITVDGIPQRSSEVHFKCAYSAVESINFPPATEVVYSQKIVLVVR